MTGAIILAAGASTRLGQPKQKLLYKGISLLQHVINTAYNAGCKPVVVVLGANAEDMEANLEKEPVIVVNPNWQEGMSSSIRLGVEALQQKAPEISSVILLVCDQPFVTTSLLENLIETQAETDKKIVASSYKNILGVPVLFDKSLFPELLLLTGDIGAKKLVSFYEEVVAAVAFPEGTIDIDTMEDYECLKKD